MAKRKIGLTHTSETDPKKALDHAGVRALGVHRGDLETVFRVFAPRAEQVSLVGTCNGWDPTSDPMKKAADGTWFVKLPTDRVPSGMLYKFAVRESNGVLRFKADPRAFASEEGSGRASVVFDPNEYRWRDDGWLDFRKDRYDKEHARSAPLNICSITSENARSVCADPKNLFWEIVPYVKQMGYTHVALRGACGYQNAVGGCFSPTHAYGDPENLMHLIDAFHEAGVGVLFDLNVTSFPKGEHGLSNFDGQALYEYADSARASDTSCDALRFDLTSSTVRSFLIDSALFWVEAYHVDGFLLADLAPALYLDYGRAPGEWTPNAEGDSRDLVARDFFGVFHRALAEHHPDVITIAAETTAWADVTGKRKTGLGFAFKENSGWADQTRAYFTADRKARSICRLTDPIAYAFSEAHLLPIPQISADPAVKRVLYAFGMTYPGKKLTAFDAALLPDADARLQYYLAALNRFYLSEPALWAGDGDEKQGFEWLGDAQAEPSVLSYLRRGTDGKELLILIHLLPERRDCYRQKTPCSGIYEEIFHTDATEFGGTGCVNARVLEAEPDPQAPKGAKRRCGYLRLTLPPMGVVVFRRRGKG